MNDEMTNKIEMFNTDLLMCMDRLLKLELYIFGHQLGEKNLSNRVQDLESSIVDDHEDILDIEARLDILNDSNKNLEKSINDIESKLNSINFLPDLINRAIKVFQDSDGLKPFKCPICEGNKMIRMGYMSGQEDLLNMSGWRKDPLGYFVKECDTCEGKGIVWG